MKKLFLVLLIFFAYGASYALPNNDCRSYRSLVVAAQDSTTKDYLSMQGGKMILVQNDKATRMAKDMTMKNGTVVRVNGEVVTQDGHTFQLKEGDRVYMNGRIDGPAKAPIQ